MASCFRDGLFAFMILTIFSPTLQFYDTIDKYFDIRYEYLYSENMENVLKALNSTSAYLQHPVGLVDRLGKIGPYYDYFSSGNPGYWERMIFELDKKFSYNTIDRRQVYSTITNYGPKLIELQVEPHGRVTKIIRTFTPQTLIIEIRVGKVIGTRVYLKSKEKSTKKQPKTISSVTEDSKTEETQEEEAWNGKKPEEYSSNDKKPGEYPSNDKKPEEHQPADQKPEELPSSNKKTS